MHITPTNLATPTYTRRESFLPIAALFSVFPYVAIASTNEDKKKVVDQILLDLAKLHVPGFADVLRDGKRVFKFRFLSHPDVCAYLKGKSKDRPNDILLKKIINLMDEEHLEKNAGTIVQVLDDGRTSYDTYLQGDLYNGFLENHILHPEEPMSSFKQSLFEFFHEAAFIVRCYKTIKNTTDPIEARIQLNNLDPYDIQIESYRLAEAALRKLSLQKIEKSNEILSRLMSKKQIGFFREDFLTSLFETEMHKSALSANQQALRLKDIKKIRSTPPGLELFNFRRNPEPLNLEKIVIA